MNSIPSNVLRQKTFDSSAIRALLVIARYWPAIGGAEMHSREMLKHLRRQGVHPKVLCHASNQQIPNERAILEAPNHSFLDNEIPVEQKTYSHSVKPLVSLLAHAYPNNRWCRPIYNSFIRRFSAKSITDSATHCQLIHNVYCGMTMVSEAALVAAKKLNIPFVFTPLARTCDGPGNAWATKRLLKLYEGADAVIALTEHERAWLISLGVSANKVHVCPMAPLLPSQIPEPEAATNLRSHLGLNNEPIVLFLGRHDESKGYQALVEASGRIWQSKPDTQLVFFGPQTDTSRAYFSSVSDPRIHLVESPCQALKMSALESCNLLCVPSVKESLGVVYLEAWHSGKPVIAGDIPVLRGLIDHGKNGFVCHPNAHEVARYVLRILRNRKLSAQMGERGRSLVASTYTWPTIAQKINHIYQMLICSQRMTGALPCTYP